MLLDALRLRMEYSDEEFTAVIEVLAGHGDDPLLGTMLELLRDLESPVPERQRRGSKTGIGPPGAQIDMLERIKESRPAAFALLSEADQLVGSNAIFRTAVELQQFVAERIKGPVRGKPIRRQLVAQYVSALSELPDSELETEVNLLRELKARRPGDVEGFLRMADRIVRGSKAGAPRMEQPRTSSPRE